MASCTEQISEKFKQALESEMKVLLNEVLNRLDERLEAWEWKKTDKVCELISAEFGRLSEVRIVIFWII